VKPSGPVARRADYALIDVDLDFALWFFTRHHYSKGCAKQAAAVHGLVRRGVIIGVAFWMPPPKPAAVYVAKKLGGVHNDVLSLSRLAVVPDEPQNVASMLIGRSIRALPARWTRLLTFADESQGHTGTIYRATGWIEDGHTGKRVRWVDADGKHISPFSTKSISVKELERRGCRRDGYYTKIRFIRRR
jgi:hypothetical protein